MTFVRRLIRASFMFVLLVILTGLSFLAGYLFYGKQSQALHFPLLEEAYGLVREHGWKDLPAAPQVEYGLIRGLLQAYDDPYTVFLEPPQNELETNRLAGRYGGIGAQVEQDQQGAWRVYPFPDSPALKAGLQEGDRLLWVDKLEITSQVPSDTLLAALRGPIGSQVAMTVSRPPDETPIQVSVARSEIALPSVTWRLATEEPRLGIIKVNWMAATTAEEIERAVTALRPRGATHFALDLRDNPGGLLDSGVNIARLFLKDGQVMQEQYRGRAVETFSVEKTGPLVDIPLVVMINHGSASAAEIAAGALQARQRAPLVGQPSYGKDTVQLVFDLQDGSSLHVTSAHWWVPGQEGKLAGVGLQPDIAVLAPQTPDGPDAVLQAVIKYWFGS